MSLDLAAVYVKLGLVEELKGRSPTTVPIFHALQVGLRDPRLPAAAPAGGRPGAAGPRADPLAGRQPRAPARRPKPLSARRCCPGATRSAGARCRFQASFTSALSRFQVWRRASASLTTRRLCSNRRSTERCAAEVGAGRSGLPAPRAWSPADRTRRARRRNPAGWCSAGGGCPARPRSPAGAGRRGGCRSFPLSQLKCCSTDSRVVPLWTISSRSRPAMRRSSGCIAINKIRLFPIIAASSTMSQGFAGRAKHNLPAGRARVV